MSLQSQLFGMLEQEDHDFKTCLCNTGRAWLKTKMMVGGETVYWYSLANEKLWVPYPGTQTKQRKQIPLLFVNGGKHGAFTGEMNFCFLCLEGNTTGVPYSARAGAAVSVLTTFVDDHPPSNI